MTLDEAIRHAEKVAERLETSCKRDWMGEDDERCASEHRQLAEWLKDYRRLLEQQSCEDTVSRQFMYELGATCIATRSKNGKLIALGTIEELPPAIPQPKIGR